MNTEALRQALAADLYVTEAGSKIALSITQYALKTSNIDSFFSIDRTGLKNKEREHLLLMYRSSVDEKIYIEYPGKESTIAYAVSAANRILNPYDFRPELYLHDGTLIARLSFLDIANSILEYKQHITTAQLQIFAALLIRIAFMEGYSYFEEAHPRFLVTFENGARSVSSSESSLNLGRHFLRLNSELKQELQTWPLVNVPSRKYDSTVPISIEGLLYYMDMLAQQEDCKYYYSAQRRGSHHMSVSIGRINNLLTIVNIIDRLLLGKPINDIIKSLKIGVAPIAPINFGRVTGNIITVHQDFRSISKLNIRTD